MAARKGLDVAPTLMLPMDMVTQTFALLAVRRAGKSNAAAVMAELMYLLGLPFTGIDPKGDWWGLRSSADGKGPGLPVPIFGGLHGDMPLTPESGALMATLIVGHNLTCILDVSRFTKAARARFLAEFGEKLYDLHQQDPQPRHLFIEEADRVVPQQILRADSPYLARCVGAFSDIVRLGGAFGLGATLISQRSALISKDVLTQVETMIAMRTTSPQDRKAIRDWMEHHAISAEIIDSLPSLLSGEAWVSSSYFLPEHGLPAIQRIRFRQRTTFDSGATPAVGQKRKVATLADIDLGSIKTQMAEVTEETEKNDPVVLRRRIATLERELAKRNPGADGRVVELEDEVARLRARPPERIEVPVVDAMLIAALDQSITAMRDTASSVEMALAMASRALPAPVTASPAPRKPSRPEPGRQPVQAPEETRDPARLTVVLKESHLKILTVLAQFPEGRTTKQIAMLTGYSPNSGGFNSALAALRRNWLITQGKPVMITPAGLKELGDDWEPLPTGPELVEHWLAKLSTAEGKILRVLLETWPGTMTAKETAEAAGYSANSGGFNSAIAHLRTLDLITGPGRPLGADDNLAAEYGKIPGRTR